MTRLEELQLASTKKHFARLLEVNASFLTRTLYKRSVPDQYYQFKIKKRSGGERIINAPSAELKDLQSRLSELLLDCIDDINKIKNIKSTLSHGFTRKRSIITNAEMHLNKKYVLNIDLNDFFDSFNFGRVRGFFIKNKNFELHEDIATVIAKIACLNNALPQGSPCSPVITNLITHSLDIRLASLAKKNSCTYSRYADDITLSTRKSSFPTSIIRKDGELINVGKRLRNEVERAGFTINNKKTRLQYKDSRQDVTGLIVNKKLNIKKEYWRLTRAMCHQLFRTGSFTIQTEEGKRDGNLFELEGRLNFIDLVDRYHRLNQKNKAGYISPKKGERYYRNKLNVREKTYSKFLYYKYFQENPVPTILCEGKTDNIYLKSAINMLAEQYPLLVEPKLEKTPYKLLINFFRYSKKTRFILDLYGGGTHLLNFVLRYIENMKHYKSSSSNQPVILLLDNDSGPDGLLGYLQGNSTKYPKCPDKKEDMRKSNFMPIIGNLYIILIPRKNNSDTEIERFFDKATHEIKVDGKTFSPDIDEDTETTYSKTTFANKVIKEKKSEISFDGFKEILNQVVSVIEYHKKL